jgi:hypothetical protein
MDLQNLVGISLEQITPVKETVERLFDAAARHIADAKVRRSAPRPASRVRTENLPDGAIKFVRADTLQREAQLVRWGAAVTLSHPHLIRLFDVGRCKAN